MVEEKAEEEAVTAVESTAADVGLKTAAAADLKTAAVATGAKV